ncbi:MAG: zinc ribbon domain-containing protein [Nostocaceae cyanobacterium]|nr:zinc ribbon domain-containing protein [Nostocaceae cyanobacterium]
MISISCPHCHQPVDRQAVICPSCRTTLKAFGHPGIPLHRATGEGYLCDTCTYHADDTCNFPQRPLAKECTLYQNLEQSQLELQQQKYSSSFAVKVKNWVRQNQVLLLLLGLLLISFLVAL